MFVIRSTVTRIFLRVRPQTTISRQDAHDVSCELSGHFDLQRATGAPALME